jgi:hypothetical protein
MEQFFNLFLISLIEQQILMHINYSYFKYVRDEGRKRMCEDLLPNYKNDVTKNKQKEIKINEKI